MTVDSAAYARMDCHKCRPTRMADSMSLGSYETSTIVWRWVHNKVVDSEYIWEVSKRCAGCFEVYELRCAVLGNLLCKLGVRIR